MSQLTPRRRFQSGGESDGDDAGPFNPASPSPTSEPAGFTPDDPTVKRISTAPGLVGDDAGDTPAPGSSTPGSSSQVAPPAKPKVEKPKPWDTMKPWQRALVGLGAGAVFGSGTSLWGPLGAAGMGLLAATLLKNKHKPMDESTTTDTTTATKAARGGSIREGGNSMRNRLGSAAPSSGGGSGSSVGGPSERSLSGAPQGGSLMPIDPGMSAPPPPAGSSFQGAPGMTPGGAANFANMMQGALQGGGASPISLPGPPPPPPGGASLGAAPPSVPGLASAMQGLGIGGPPPGGPPPGGPPPAAALGALQQGGPPPGGGSFFGAAPGGPPPGAALGALAGGPPPGGPPPGGGSFFGAAPGGPPPPGGPPSGLQGLVSAPPPGAAVPPPPGAPVMPPAVAQPAPMGPTAGLGALQRSLQGQRPYRKGGKVADRQWGGEDKAEEPVAKKKGGKVLVKKPAGKPKVSIAVALKKPTSTPSPYDYEDSEGTAPSPGPGPAAAAAPPPMKKGGKFGLRKNKGGSCEKMAAGGAAKVRKGFPNTKGTKKMAHGGKVRGCGIAKRGTSFSGVF